MGVIFKTKSDLRKKLNFEFSFFKNNCNEIIKNSRYKYELKRVIWIQDYLLIENVIQVTKSQFPDQNPTIIQTVLQSPWNQTCVKLVKLGLEFHELSWPLDKWTNNLWLVSTLCQLWHIWKGRITDKKRNFKFIFTSV